MNLNMESSLTTVYNRQLDRAQILEHLDKLIEDGDVNKLDEDGNSALHLAIKANVDLDILRKLTDKGGNVNVPNNKGISPLFQCLQENGDVNKLDINGNTVLHYAVATNAGVEILNNLLEQGANVNVNNMYDISPMLQSVKQYVEMGTGVAFMNLLQLDERYHFRDEEQNTLLHLILDHWLIETERFWSESLTQLQKLQVNFNVANKYGQTPLHVAATKYCTASLDLSTILDNFLNVDMFACDVYGNTFLHSFFAGNIEIDEDDLNFVSYLCQGKFLSCPQSAVAKLLNWQNSTGNTPMYLALKFKLNEVTLKLLKTITNAGADINATNSFGDTLLHCICGTCQTEDVLTEAVKFLVRNGANLNSQNSNGETPVFITIVPECVKTLIDHGAEMNMKDRCGRNVLLYHIRKPHMTPGLLKLLLQAGVDVNKCDMYGNSVLHYCAWHGTHPEVLQALKENGVKVSCDNLGQLPCQVAFQRGNKKLLELLCNCPKTCHQPREHLNLVQETIDYSELEETTHVRFEPIQKRFEALLKDPVLDVLHLPDIGILSFEGEAELVRLEVSDVVKQLCRDVAKDDDFFANTVIQSGSVSEGTKVGLPDEFDFVCILDTIGDIFEVDEQKSKADVGFVHLRLKPAYTSDDRYKWCCKDDGSIDTNVIRQRFTAKIVGRICKPHLWLSGKVTLSHDVYKDDESITPTVQFSLKWTGCRYKALTIDIDLVPACRINGWWPEDTNIGILANDNEVHKQGCLLLFHTSLTCSWRARPETKLRVSVMNAEKCFFGMLPKLAKEAYMLSKILCNTRLCPALKVNQKVKAKTFLTSYMLKNCLFYICHENDLLKGMSTSIDGVRQAAILIFKKLLHFAQEENLKSFFLPWQNVFTFLRLKYIGPDKEYETHIWCTHRIVFIKFILCILGEKQDFQDIDIEALCDMDDLALI